MAKSRTKRLDESSWIDEALEVLAEQSIDAVGIEPLARRLRVTKGSFYWHFRDRSALLNAILRRWQQRATLSVIECLEHGGMPAAERLWRLQERSQSSLQARRNVQVELAIRGWARKDKVAAAAVAEVDQQRLSYIQSLCRALGFSEDESRVRAFLLYAVQFGECLIKIDETDTARGKRHEQLTKSIVGSDKAFSKSPATTNKKPAPLANAGTRRANEKRLLGAH
jgi:AcrR family transcriptional regulator